MSNWWANKLGTPQQQTHMDTPVIPAQVAQTPAPVLPPTYQQAPPSPRCPNCRSANYVGTQESRARCYDCGYPVVQSGSGIPGISSSSNGPAQPARQVQGGGFNPQTIVGKLD